MARAFSFSPNLKNTTLSSVNEITSDLYPIDNPQYAPTVIFRDRNYDLSSSSISRYAGATYDPYNYTSILRNTVDNEEPGLYTQYRESYMSNPYTTMVVEALVEKVLGDGYHFEGSGASRVEKFFEEDGTHKKIENLIRDAIIFGNGFMDFGFKARANKYVKTRVLDPELISIEIETDANKPEYGERIYKQGGKELKSDLLFHLTLRTITGNAYGISPLRQNLYFLQLLLDSGGDVGAAMKRMSYAPLDIALDLDGVPTQAQKDATILSHEEKFKTFNSATNNIIHDKRHSIQLVGTGSSGGRLLPTNQMLEPIISVILRNFGIPIGVFLQQGANKAIVMEQREEIRAFFGIFKMNLKREIEKNIVQRVAKSGCNLIWNKAPPTTQETQSEMKIMMMLYDIGIIPRQQFLDMFDMPIMDGDFKEQGGGGSLQETSHTMSPKDGIDTPNYESGEQ